MDRASSLFEDIPVPGIERNLQCWPHQSLFFLCPAVVISCVVFLFSSTMMAFGNVGSDRAFVLFCLTRASGLPLFYPSDTFSFIFSPRSGHFVNLWSIFVLYKFRGVSAFLFFAPCGVVSCRSCLLSYSLFVFVSTIESSCSFPKTVFLPPSLWARE